MYSSIPRFFGGIKGEERKIWFLLAKGFSMGVFLATYQIGSESLFIQELGKEYLHIAFFTTGVLGVLSTILFSKLQDRVKYSTLILSNIFLTFLFVAGTRLSFVFVDLNALVGFNILPFILFTMMGPITVVTLLEFWGVFGRMFDVRQSKRIIGGIDSGQLVAIIIAFYSIPLVTRLPFFNSTYDLLLLSSGASFAMFVFTLMIVVNFNLDKSWSGGIAGAKRKAVQVKTLVRNPFTRLLSLFLIFSSGVAVFVNYTFYSTVQTMYPEEQKLNDFLAGFSGTVMVFSFILQSFFNDMIIRKFGLKVALMLMPIGLILFTVCGIVTGHMYGFSVKTEEFLLFFMFIVSAKAYTAILKDALESPTFKLFFLPFNINIRFSIQARIEGVVNEIAVLLAGAGQLALGLLVFFDLIHFSYLVISLSVMVIWLAHRLYNQYKITLKKTLGAQQGTSQEDDLGSIPRSMDFLHAQLTTKDPSTLVRVFKIYRRLDPLRLRSILLDFLAFKSAQVRQQAYQLLGDLGHVDARKLMAKELETEGDPRIQATAKRALKHLEELGTEQINEATIRQLVRSPSVQKRMKATKMLQRTSEDKYVPYLLELLRDLNPEVRKSAIETAGLLKRPEAWPILLDYVKLPAYSASCLSSLTYCGESAFYTIDAAFYRSGQSSVGLQRIAQLLGRINTVQGPRSLWKKIDFPDSKVLHEIIMALGRVKLTLNTTQIGRLKTLVDELAFDVTWNIKAIQDIPTFTSLDHHLHDAITEENQLNYDGIFLLLGIIYGVENVIPVKNNIQVGTVESVTFAMEMLEIFLDEDLKPKLRPLLDEMSDKERLARLRFIFPPESFSSYEDLLRQIINRNYNSLSRYAKALAIYRLRFFDGAEVTDDLIALLFNDDPLLRETAAWVVFEIDKQSYHRNSRRLKPSLKLDLDTKILPPSFFSSDQVSSRKMYRIQRVLFLRTIEVFKSLSGEVITFLADLVREEQYPAGKSLVKSTDRGNHDIFIVEKGEVRVTRSDKKSTTAGPGSVIGMGTWLETEGSGIAASSIKAVRVLLLTKDDYFDLMLSHASMMTPLLAGKKRRRPPEESLKESTGYYQLTDTG